MAAKVAESTASGVELETAFGRFTVEPRAGFHPGQTVDLGFRPEAVQIGLGPVNNLSAVIHSVSYLGEVEQYHLQLSGGEIIKAIEPNPMEIRTAGTPLSIHIRPRDCLIFSAA